MRLGDWDATIVSAGTFRLDGGSMFGTVPRVVWERLCPADAEHRILMDTNVLLLRGRGRTILVDTGNGDKEPEAFRERFAMGPRGALEAGLRAAGVTPGDVDTVLLTHLHFDHAGGVTRLDADGQAVPTFPRARHLLQARDLANATSGFIRERASYLPWNWEPLQAAGLLDLVDGPHEVLPGLRLRPVPGHTPGLQAVEVEGGGRRLVYLADLIPTSHHIQPAWCMGYDLDVPTCVAERQQLLSEVAGTDTILVFEHDPEVRAGTVAADAKGRYRVTPVDL
ncbi:MBL fold metallo-hydrolase [Mesoterricola sediminis]|uniref:MBL fold metallo-hydrolase n=1 Tax=Mesoterricola sediminis TaxID=2927980 RepID=A0AA48GXC2_9BACT|nr:MBL fold metallo-hydrolase [Mesoterricola sediminis]BDU77365.1 MBL fold metallo-hydrolase [Mesoterricola sediminis]